MADTIIEVQGVSKTFKVGSEQERLFNGISIDIQRGEFVALTGTTGCGKSTLLNLIGGLDHPDEGRVLVHKTEVGRLSPAARARFLNKHIGFIFQFHHLLPEQTAASNVMLPMRIGGVNSRKARTRAEELLDKLGLGPRINAYPPTMSGGEKQRVAIARALAMKPDVLLADEPTGSLNPAFKEEVFQSLLSLSKHEGATVVMVTHDHNLIKDDSGYRVDREVDVSVLAQQNNLQKDARSQSK
jgi:lipoprotein-releasing system ATP-binding protein